MRGPRIWGSLKSELFAEIRHIWYKIVPKTQFKRESFGKSVPPIASFELPVRYHTQAAMQQAQEEMLMQQQQAEAMRQEQMRQQVTYVSCMLRI